MGYEIHIERGEGNKITFEEWNKFIEQSNEFKKIESQDTYVWTINRLEVLFTFSKEWGWISVKNPHEFIIKKMVEISKFFKGSVIGEEGEEYDENFSFEEFS